MILRYPLPLLTNEIPPIELSPQHTCLLLQDVHAPFWPGGCLQQRAKSLFLAAEFDSYYHQAVLAEGNMQAVLALSRGHGLRVVYASLGYYPPASPSPFQQATGWEWDLSTELGSYPARLQPLAEEPVWAKPGWGAVTAPLLRWLEDMDLRSVVLAGCMIEFGLRQTALQLADHGYPCLLLSDATTALSPAGRVQAQHELVHGLIKARFTAEYQDLMHQLVESSQVLV